jgi:hypothetical protein
LPPSPIDNAPQPLKELGHPLYFIQDDQLALVVRQVVDGAGKLGAFVLVLKIQINRGLPCADLQSQRGLSGLARPQQDDRWRMAKQVTQPGTEASRQHLCNYRALLHIYIITVHNRSSKPDARLHQRLRRQIHIGPRHSHLIRRGL